MAENVHDNLIDRLRSGENVVCPQCGEDYLQPYNTTYDKAHCFNCSKCGFHAHWDPVIDIE